MNPPTSTHFPPPLIPLPMPLTSALNLPPYPLRQLQKVMTMPLSQSKLAPHTTTILSSKDPLPDSQPPYAAMLLSRGVLLNPTVAIQRLNSYLQRRLYIHTTLGVSMAVIACMSQVLRRGKALGHLISISYPTEVVTPLTRLIPCP